MKCWGSGGNGRLGNKSTTDQTTPVDVHSSSVDSTPLSGVVQLSAGYYHTCALTSLGGVKCWGRGASGQVGNKSTTDQTKPVDVHTSSSDSGSLDLGILGHFYHHQCDSGNCTYYNPSASISGTGATPTFTASNLKASDIVTIYTSSTCDASTKNKAMTVASGQTSANTTLSSLGSSGTYKLYFTLQRTGYRPVCLGPIKYTF